jgi:hypothetical protein
MGFFEAGNFYPDFLLWQVRGKKQSIAFIEPHGLQHEGPGHKKIEFHTLIKQIEARLSDVNITLNSFIITPTRFGRLNWGRSLDELEAMNVLFMEDQKNSYIHSIFSKMAIADEVINYSELPDSSWARATRNEHASAAPLAQLAAIADLLHQSVPISFVRLAALYALEPSYLTRQLSGSKRNDWLRLVGPEAEMHANNVTAFTPRIDGAWRSAVNLLIGMGAIIEDSSRQTWKRGQGLDQFYTGAWSTGRANFVLQALQSLSKERVLSELPTEDQTWIAANAA